MRARRSAYESAGAGFALRPVVQQRDGLAEPAGWFWMAVVGSLLAHGAVLAIVLLTRHGMRSGEVQNAPSFAIEFESGSPQSAPPTPPSEPRVSLGGEDEAPPPPEQREAGEAVPPPPLHYGTALRQRSKANPFAQLVPFDLSSPHPSSSATRRKTTQLDLSAGPVVREGKLSDAITHAPGTEVSGDYDAELKAFVEAHRQDIEDSLRDAEAGQAVLQVTIARDGHVLALHLLRPSHSALLDAAWMSFFRNYRLPALSNDITGPTYTFAYELDYSIIYGPPGR